MPEHDSRSLFSFLCRWWNGQVCDSPSPRGSQAALAPFDPERLGPGAANDLWDDEDFSGQLTSL